MISNSIEKGILQVSFSTFAKVMADRQEPNDGSPDLSYIAPAVRLVRRRRSLSVPQL